MKKVKPQLWHHYRDTPFEVMSVILFSALVFGGAGAAMAHNAMHAEPSHPAQRTQVPHSSSSPGTAHSVHPILSKRSEDRAE